MFVNQNHASIAWKISIGSAGMESAGNAIRWEQCNQDDQMPKTNTIVRSQWAKESAKLGGSAVLHSIQLIFCSFNKIFLSSDSLLVRNSFGCLRCISITHLLWSSTLNPAFLFGHFSPKKSTILHSHEKISFKTIMRWFFGINKVSE